MGIWHLITNTSFYILRLSTTVPFNQTLLIVQCYVNYSYVLCIPFKFLCYGTHGCDINVGSGYKCIVFRYTMYDIIIEIIGISNFCGLTIMIFQ